MIHFFTQTIAKPTEDGSKQESRKMVFRSRRFVQLLRISFYSLLIFATACGGSRATTKDGLAELRDEAKGEQPQEVIDEIINELPNIPPELRVDAVDAINEVEGDPGSKALGQMLESPQANETPEMKERILEHLKNRPDQTALEVLLDAGAKGTIPMDPALMKHFGGKKFKPAIPEIKKVVESGPDRRAALEALAMMEDEETDRYILSLADNPDHPASLDAWATLPLLRTEAGKKAVSEKKTGSKDNREVLALLKGLGDRPYDSENFKTLKKYYLNSTNPEIRSQAFDSMVKMKNIDPAIAKDEMIFSVATAQALVDQANPVTPNRDEMPEADGDRGEEEPEDSGEQTETVAIGAALVDSQQSGGDSKESQPEEESKGEESESSSNEKSSEQTGEKQEAEGGEEAKSGTTTGTEKSDQKEKENKQSSPAKKKETSPTKKSEPKKGAKVAGKKKQPQATGTTARRKKTGPAKKVPLPGSSDAVVNRYRNHLYTRLENTFGSERGGKIEIRLHNALVSYSETNTNLSNFVAQAFVEKYGLNTDSAKEVMGRGLNHPGVLGIIVDKVNREYGTENMRNYALSILFDISRWEADILRQIARESRL